MIRNTNFHIYGFYHNGESMGILLKDQLGRYPIMADRYRCTLASPYNMDGCRKTRKISKKQATQLVEDLKHNPCMRDYDITLDDIHACLKKWRKHENKTC